MFALLNLYTPETHFLVPSHIIIIVPTGAVPSLNKHVQALLNYEVGVSLKRDPGPVPPKEVFEEIRKNKRRRRIILHYDNAMLLLHVGRNNSVLKGQKIELTDRPLYSPNFYLFPRVKTNTTFYPAYFATRFPACTHSLFALHGRIVSEPDPPRVPPVHQNIESSPYKRPVNLTQAAPLHYLVRVRK
ncbi:hypothetical protein EVAR_98480_1 [Eumeta japonica]|uniref:Uncharacterized protein n=1 Tax=Eumeta variegata TaxID=151549 RepID=A0A4C1YH25_EUMVA|nr:hypothetical protein EVAR_98480_1 [Eumeta japonica]